MICMWKMSYCSSSVVGARGVDHLDAPAREVLRKKPGMVRVIARLDAAA